MSSMEWAAKDVWRIAPWEEVREIEAGTVFCPVIGRRTRETYIAPVVKIGDDDYIVTGKSMILSLSELRFEIELGQPRGFDGFVYILREGSTGHPVYEEIKQEEV